MKKIIVSVALLVATMSLGMAQDKNAAKGYTKDGKTFTQQKASRGSSSGDRATTYTWKDSKGNEYPIVLHTYTRGEKAGRTTCYVVRTSAKTGKEYKYYIPDGEAIAAEILGGSENVNSKSI